MKTMEKLVERFNSMNPDYHAELLWMESYPGWYTVVIESSYAPIDYPTYYHFRTCDDFREWMDGVVLY